MFFNHGPTPAYAEASAYAEATADRPAGRRTVLTNVRAGRKRSVLAARDMFASLRVATRKGLLRPQRAVAVICGRAALVAAVLGVSFASFAADPTISVEARQRYPWNGLVDLNFTITGTSGTKYDTSFTAKDMVGNTNITMVTVRKSNGVAANVTKEQLTPGNYNWVWDAAADLPKGWKSDRVTVTGTAIGGFSYSVKFNANGGTGTMSNESFTYGTAKALTANAFKRTGYTFQGWATSSSGSKVYNDKQSVSNLTTTSGAVVNLYAVWKSALYMVIDLSSGSSSSSYPISYLDAVPSGGWSDTYKKTKLVLRRIEPGTFKMQGNRNVTLTKAFYIGVFEVTQKQYELVVGSNPAYETKADKLPAINTSYNEAKAFLSPLASKTSLKFTLPTEAQWEYACRAGTSSSYNNGGSSVSDLKVLGRYKGNKDDGKTQYKDPYYDVAIVLVGQYQANAWGLYDMHGNALEWVLDWYGDLGTNAVTDPTGPSSGDKRVQRGGGVWCDASSCTSSSRRYDWPSSKETWYYNRNSDISYGFRVGCNL